MHAQELYTEADKLLTSKIICKLYMTIKLSQLMRLFFYISPTLLQRTSFLCVVHDYSPKFSEIQWSHTTFSMLP